MKTGTNLNKVLKMTFYQQKPAEYYLAQNPGSKAVKLLTNMQFPEK